MKIFIVLTGGYGNIGDALIRRDALRWVRGLGQVHAFVGAAPQHWQEQLGLEPGDTVYPAAEQVRWVRALLRAGRNAVLVWEPGEVHLDPGSVPRESRFLAVTALARLRGATVIRSPRSVRRPSRIAVALHRAACRLSARTFWRDAESLRVIRVGRTVPDIGFAEDAEAGLPWAERRRLTVSIRGGRPLPPEEWFEAIRRVARRAGDLRITVLAQVREDEDRAREVAARLGGEHGDRAGHGEHVEHIPRGERTDLEQEAVVRRVYGESRLVVSDRLHVLVLALLGGAVPAEAVASPTRKIAEHLAVAGITGITFDAAGRTADEIAAFLDEAVTRGEVTGGARESATGATGPGGFAEPLAAARAVLAGVRDDIREVIGGAAAASVPRVLLSMPGPDGRTRFVDHLTRHALVRYRYWSWRTALFGRYDVLHVHWPEVIVRGRGRALKVLLARLLLLRLRLQRIPIVRTVHNVRPHARGTSAESRFLDRLDRQTALAIALNPVTPPLDGVPSVLIVHGGYREPFGSLPVEAPVRHRLLYFGRIEPYKGVGTLIAAFRGLPEAFADWTLRLVGEPTVPLRAEVEAALEASDRITAALGFVPDAELVAEVTAADLVVLPYLEMDNSGVILVALSLGRQVVVPRTAVNEWLADEVGPGWVLMFDGALSAAALEAMLASRPARPVVPPVLIGRDWTTVAEAHARAYAQALAARS